MPLMSRQQQDREQFSAQIEAMKRALEGMQRAVSIAGRSLTKTFTTWRESLERAGIDVDKLTGVRYEKPVIIDDPLPRCRCTFEPIIFKVPVVPTMSIATQERIAALSSRVLAELGPGPGRDG
jgi:hypothetical protein